MNRRWSTSTPSKQPNKQSEKFKLPPQQKVTREEREMKEHIRKQDVEIEKLQKEQQDLNQKLSIALPLPKQDPTVARKCDDIDEKMLIELRIQKDLEKEIEKKRLKVEELKKRERRRPDIRKMTKSLQNASVKLDTVTQAFNKQRVENETLRGELKLIYNEYLIFRDEMNNLKKILNEVRNQTEEAIQETTDLEIEMLKADSHLTQMMAKQEKDIAKYTNQMFELNVVIKHQTNLTNFLDIKNRKRGSQVEIRSEKKLMKLKMDLERDTKYLDSLRQQYQELLAVTRSDDVETAITKFDNEEKQGFLLLIDVMQQQKEILGLKKEISEIQNKLDNRDTKHLPDSNQDLNKNLGEIESLTKSHENRSKAIIKFQDDIMPGLNEACAVLEVEPTGDGLMLNHYEKILHYLGVLEERTNKLIAIQNYLNTKDQDGDSFCEDEMQTLLVQDSEQLLQASKSMHIIESEEYDFSEDEQPLQLEGLIKQVKQDLQRERTATVKPKSKTQRPETQEQKQMEEELVTTVYKREKAKCPYTVAQWLKQLQEENERVAAEEAKEKLKRGIEKMQRR